MNLSFFIAKRYFFSRNKKNFIHIVSLISMIGVSAGTMALVIVLSVFNGLEDLFRSLYGTFNSDLQIAPATGKFFDATDSLLTKIRQTDGVALVSEVLEDNALLTYRDQPVVVKMRGVSENFLNQTGLDSMIVAGDYALRRNNRDQAIIGTGVQYLLSLPLTDEGRSIQVWYPNTTQKAININALDPSNAFQRQNIRVGAVFKIEQQYDDNYIFVPLSFARDLIRAGNKRSSLEITVKPGYRISRVQRALKQRVGDEFLVQDQDEQHANLLRAIQIEKLFVYVTFSFIIVIASFNIFFSLTMLAIDKHKDVSVLYAMGATSSFIQRLFMAEGAIIACIGACTGLFVGFFLCWLQSVFGFISMGMQTSVVDAYPVKMEWTDFILTGFIVIIIALFFSYFPARKASKEIAAKL